MESRKEVPPAQQLEGLRKARDHYSALADQIHNSPPELGESRAEHWAREKNARRVAAAYDNSVVTQKALLPRDGD
jgi:hypothetical protein